MNELILPIILSITTSIFFYFIGYAMGESAKLIRLRKLLAEAYHDLEYISNRMDVKIDYIRSTDEVLLKIIDRMKAEKLF